jgi:hypothetical protein
MLDLNFDYASCIRNSEKVNWTIDEVMPAGTRLDFEKPFLPEPLASTRALDFLGDKERLTLNHITGNAYLNLFGFVEEYIIATTVQHAQAEMFGDHDAIRALLRFGEEEVKHQRLFVRYREAFERDFGHACDVLESAAEVAGAILSKSPIAVMLVTLHLEIMTQQHYTDCVRDNAGVDPFFARLLKHHWLEEAQHARIDALELDKLLEDADEAAISKAFEDYFSLIDAFDGLLASQSEMDVTTLSRALGRAIDGAQAKSIIASQHAAYRYTFLVSGMRNPQFVSTVEKISSQQAKRLDARATQLS